jgi:hypothetical protein
MCTVCEVQWHFATEEPTRPCKCSRTYFGWLSYHAPATQYDTSHTGACVTSRFMQLLPVAPMTQGQQLSSYRTADHCRGHSQDCRWACCPPSPSPSTCPHSPARRSRHSVAGKRPASRRCRPLRTRSPACACINSNHSHTRPSQCAEPRLRECPPRSIRS